jgi:hypothetical protein
MILMRLGAIIARNMKEAAPVSAGWFVPAYGAFAKPTFGFMPRPGCAGTNHPTPTVNPKVGRFSKGVNR